MVQRIVAPFILCRTRKQVLKELPALSENQIAAYRQAVEQTTARGYRMGQRHPVQVYKPITAGTLEEKIHGLIEQKRALAAELIVEDDGSILKTLSRKELAGLFRYG